MSTTSLIVVALILLMFFCILSSLALGLYYLVSDQGKTKHTVKALTIRIILSIILFLALFIAFAMGWIAPHGILGSPGFN